MSSIETKRGIRKKRVGKVISNKMHKTITILVERRVRHKLYGKEVRMFTKLHAHDENNEAQIGDMVTVAETRPMSKLKRWRLVNVVK